MSKNYILGLCFTFFVYHASFGQQIEVSATIDSLYILIGSQTNITLEVTKPSSRDVQFPLILDTLSRDIEVLDQTPLDSTSLAEEQNTRLTKTLTVTSFEGGYHTIPPFKFFTKNEVGGIDTLMTNPLSLEVLLVPVDTTQAIKPIKAPEEIPYTIRDAMPWILGGLLLLAIVLGIIFFLRRKKEPEAPVLRPIPKEPAHVIAYRELDKLKEEKLWQSGEVKAFHSRLTEIIRGYIEHRFQIPALERTSDEVFKSFKDKELAEKIPFEDLHRMLMLADLVKFAKGQPEPSENHNSLEQAYAFVQKTFNILIEEKPTSDLVDTTEEE